MTNDIEKRVFDLCDSVATQLWEDVDLLRTESGSNPLEQYLYDWALVLCVLAADTFESVVVLVKNKHLRGAHMLSRALIDYDIRLRYYVVQSKKTRRAYKNNPSLPLDKLKEEMHAARDWENSDFKLASTLTLYDADLWTPEMRKQLDNMLATDQTEQSSRFLEMLDYLQRNESKIRRIIPMFQNWLNYRYSNIKPTWKNQSALLHGDQMVVTDVIEFQNSQKTGTIFKHGSAPPYTIIWTAIDNIIELMQSVADFRGWVPGAHALRDRAAKLWEAVRHI